MQTNHVIELSLSPKILLWPPDFAPNTAAPEVVPVVGIGFVPKSDTALVGVVDEAVFEPKIDVAVVAVPPKIVDAVDAAAPPNSDAPPDVPEVLVGPPKPPDDDAAAPNI